MMKKIVNIFHLLVLPFFPESEALKKYWWHRLAKVITLIVTISSLYTILWFVSLFYFTFPPTINRLIYIPAYLPLNFANFFSNMPIYGTLFQYSLRNSILGPFTMPLILIVIFYFTPVLLYRGTLAISQRFYIKKVKVIFVLAVLGVALFSIYVWKYQRIVNEGSLIVDDHCIKVNPLIIDRKNKYLNQYNLLMANVSEKQYMEAIANYRKSAVTYMDEEKLWLARQRKFLESKEFNLFMPDYMKEAANYQYQMYEGQYYTSLYLEQAWDEKDKNKQIELSNKALEETNKSNEAQDKYNAVWEREKGKQNWMFNFVKAPISKCPPENNDIPVVPNPYAPPPPTPNSPLS